ncbi:DNA gyrase, A subunit [Oribacterium sp. oral taxon 078 str. F0263]|uniref:DNA gyrase subunit A n=1 Tax=Oribacterium sp. oral taxon 078 TaxID=652706 RepID=UPI0003AD952B|nr:DNA gyrase subunit A [Oribacterium sp. oral taxon 078]ERL20766.1 DNA gyrase, A subunit [Oribacterium sp. oral taxon 078 str. F0263]
MEPNIFDKVQDVDLKKTMENSYIDYAMSVIVSRAIPDVRDGLKPVQRRVLYSLQSLGVTPDKKTKKCATIVGETMGKYHPHGDSSIYGALVYMGQPWSMRHVLIDKQGNFGSEDGDSPAAMRYTEAKMSRIAAEMLFGINKDTVDFMPNFSNEYEEPTVLPARFPNLLVNGATGIAVGMATNIPPHNLREVIDALDLIISDRIEGRETELDEIIKKIKGPDFPTGALILGRRGIEEAYRSGRGKIKMRAVCEIEPMQSGKHRILVKELPYLVCRSRIIEKVAELVKDKKIDGITFINDAAGKGSSAKINIELRKDANPNVILNQLYKHTQLQDTFGVIMLCIVNGEPRILNLQEMLNEFLKHQINVVTRRTRYDLNKCEERAHILEGLLKALDHIDEIVRIIRAADTVEKAKQDLIARFAFSDAQAQAIVDMRLRALTGLERGRLQSEYEELLRRIARYREILSDQRELLSVIRKELMQLKEKFGEERRTQFAFDDALDDEDLIPDDDIVISSTRLGYIKRMSPENFRQQNRGGKGIRGMQTLDNDNIEDLFMSTNHHYIMLFTNKGRCFRIKGYEIPEASRTSRGTALVNLLKLQPEERVNACFSLRDLSSEQYLVLATKSGLVKKTPLSQYANVRKNGLIAMNIREDDQLIEAKLVDPGEEIMLVTKKGMAIRFREEDIRSTGRSAMGVRGIRLDSGDELIGMQKLSQGSHLLLVSEKGYGKLTATEEFKPQNRGGKGLHCYRITEKTGDLVGFKLCDQDREIMLITSEGILIRMSLGKVSVIGRNTSGVKFMDLPKNGDTVIASIAKVRESSEDEGEESEETDS